MACLQTVTMTSGEGHMRQVPFSSTDNAGRIAEPPKPILWAGLQEEEEAMFRHWLAHVTCAEVV